MGQAKRRGIFEQRLEQAKWRRLKQKERVNIAIEEYEAKKLFKHIPQDPTPEQTRIMMSHHMNSPTLVSMLAATMCKK